MTIRIPQSAIRILIALWRLNVVEELQYRANLVASVLGTLFWIGTALLTLAVSSPTPRAWAVGTTGKSSCCWACSTRSPA